jgi:ribosomal protein S18 acetylase RimI-like enzyme
MIGQIKMKIRPTRQDDLGALQVVLDSTELFPSELLPDMISGYVSGAQTDDLWLTCECEGDAIGFCYAAHEKLTDGAWNMLAIAVLPWLQSKGHGAALVAHAEVALKDRGQRILIVETSSLAAFAKTREFYRKKGYTEEARVRDFWAAGDDKIIFWKSLA